MDPKEIEDSPERAADRGREEDLGFTVSTKPSLGDPDVVRGLVSEFASQVVAVRKDYNAGKVAGEAAQARIAELGLEYGKIIMGFDSAYSALPWNDPTRLGRRIRLVTPAIDGITDPGAQLFLTLAGSLVELAVAHEEGRLPDEEVKSQADVMLEDVANLILGLR